MNGSWRTVWILAAERHGTKCGEGWLPQHQFDVLQSVVQGEAISAMVDSVGGNINFFKIDIVEEDE